MQEMEQLTRQHLQTHNASLYNTMGSTVYNGMGGSAYNAGQGSVAGTGFQQPFLHPSLYSGMGSIAGYPQYGSLAHGSVAQGSVAQGSMRAPESHGGGPGAGSVVSGM
jgi:hypothetical protein